MKPVNLLENGQHLEYSGDANSFWEQYRINLETCLKMNIRFYTITNQNNAIFDKWNLILLHPWEGRQMAKTIELIGKVFKAMIISKWDNENTIDVETIDTKIW
jgi:hypothetical protein